MLSAKGGSKSKRVAVEAAEVGIGSGDIRVTIEERAVVGTSAKLLKWGDLPILTEFLSSQPLLRECSSSSTTGFKGSVLVSIRELRLYPSSVALLEMEATASLPRLRLGFLYEYHCVRRLKKIRT